MLYKRYNTTIYYIPYYYDYNQIIKYLQIYNIIYKLNL